MSWDIFVQDIPKKVKTIDDMDRLADEVELKPLGIRSEIITKIMEILPEADFTKPAWGVLDGPDFSIEFSMGDDEDCDGFALHVRGSDTAAAVVTMILKHLGLRAFDPSSDTGLFSFENPEASLQKWRQYRDYVIDQHKDCE